MVAGCIYRNPCMDPTDFSDPYLKSVLDRLAIENKDIFFLGYFNIHILPHDINKDSQESLDKTHSNFLLSYLFSPSRVSPRS